jgi:hypothetical protein
LKQKADYNGFHRDLKDEHHFRQYVEKVRSLTQTSIERLWATYSAAKYVIQNEIPGHFVECGVWKGGSSIMAMLALMELGVNDRHFFLFDTYEGMPDPTDEDGKAPHELLERQGREKFSEMNAVGILDVAKHVESFGYPKSKTHLVAGKVEDTIPRKGLDEVAFLRLDTDWYASTLHELQQLYPILSTGGVLIVDDYGHFSGARKAVDVYFQNPIRNILLARTDNTGRMGIKP